MYGLGVIDVNRLEDPGDKIASRVIESISPEQTIETGTRLGRLVPAGSVISLEGGLGAGKTVMAKGICRGLGVADEVLSPSFILVEEYKGEVPVFHFDLYRLEELREVEDAGLYDAVNGRNIVIVEWGDRLPEGSLDFDIRIRMKITGEKIRWIEIESTENLIKRIHPVQL